jgi:hypothetical protein
MEHFDEIKDALDDWNDDTSIAAGTDVGTDRIVVASSDPMETMNMKMSRLISENADLKLRLTRVENILAGLTADKAMNTQGTRINIPTRDLFGTKAPPESPSMMSTTNSVASGPRSESASMISNRNNNDSTYGFEDPFAGPKLDSNARIIVTKSNSATAAMGYDKKASVWGTALASLLISATRYYISKTNAQGILIDEVALMKNCTNIVSPLYTSAMHRELPGVKDGTTKYLSEAISRQDRNEVPLSYASDWVELEKNQYGKDAMTVLNNLIKIAQQVPEAVIHPASQIISIMLPPVVRIVDGESKFAMSAGQPVNPVPNQWESWCLILKSSALGKYVKYRLANMSAGTVVSKMSSEMRENDLVDKKNSYRFKEVLGSRPGD